MEASTLREHGFALHDMSGNAGEWVEDGWNDSYVGAPEDGGAWTGEGDCDRRVLRGGSWQDSRWNLRSTARNWGAAGVRGVDIGSRVARTMDGAPAGVSG